MELEISSSWEFSGPVAKQSWYECVICKYVHFINDKGIIWPVVYNFTLHILTKHTVVTGNPQVPFLVLFSCFTIISS